MKTERAHGRLFRRLGWKLASGVVGLCGLTATVPQALHAQAPAVRPADTSQVAKSYMSKNVFYLPIMIEERFRAEVREVQLYVKEGPQAPWQLKDKVAPTQSAFTFRAPADGEYWFTVVTVDRSGQATDKNQDPPLIVVLDSTPPSVSVQPMNTTAAGLCVRCTVRDLHPDPFKTAFQFQTANKNWQKLDPMPGQTDQYCIPGQATFTGMVRVTASDRAGNTVTREFNLGNTQTTSGTNDEPPVQQTIYQGPQPSQPPVMVGPGSPETVIITESGPTVLPVVEHPAPMIIETSQPPRLVQSVEHTVARNTPPAVPTPAPAVEPVKAQPQPPVVTKSSTSVARQVVNQTRVFVDYQIDHVGASGVGRVEVWLTRDNGQTWQKNSDDADRKSPAELSLPGEGLFGVRFVVANGRGFGAIPPAPGESPDLWVEVDTTKPSAELVQVRAEEGNSLVVSWDVKDKNMTGECVDLFYAAKREGPWQPIIHGLKHDPSTFRWTVPSDIGSHIFVRLMTRDQAGNVATVDSAQSVPLDDLSRPRARVVGVNITTAPPSK